MNGYLPACIKSHTKTYERVHNINSDNNNRDEQPIATVLTEEELVRKKRRRRRRRSKMNKEQPIMRIDETHTKDVTAPITSNTLTRSRYPINHHHLPLHQSRFNCNNDINRGRCFNNRNNTPRKKQYCPPKAVQLPASPQSVLSFPPHQTPQFIQNKTHTCNKNYSYRYGSNSNMNIVAIDCEMVGVGDLGKRSVLGRVSLIDYYGNVLLDTFVKVNEPITDYRTFVSGIKPSDLTSDSAIDYNLCRSLVQQIIHGKILVGHALHNDLRVLDLSHPLYDIRDTSLYEPFMQKLTLLTAPPTTAATRTSTRTALPKTTTVVRPRRLKDLARSLLNLNIQTDGKSHDSLDDALASLELYKLVQYDWDCSIKMKKLREMASTKPPNYLFHRTVYRPQGRAFCHHDYRYHNRMASAGTTNRHQQYRYQSSSLPAVRVPAWL